MSYKTDKHTICRNILKNCRVQMDTLNGSSKLGGFQDPDDYTELKSKYPDQIDMVNDYEQKSKTAYGWCKAWFKEKSCGPSDPGANKDKLPVVNSWESDKQINFQTDVLVKCFPDETDIKNKKNRLLATYRIGSGGGIHSWIALHKKDDVDWTDTQKEIIKALNGVKEYKGKEDNQNDKSPRLCVILEDEYLGEPTEEGKNDEKTVRDNLNKFMDEVKKIDQILKEHFKIK